MNQISILKLIPVNNFLLRKHRLMFTIIYEHYLYSVSDYYLFLLMILLSYLPVQYQYILQTDTLLSSFRLFQRSSANSSISSGIATSFGSPSAWEVDFRHIYKYGWNVPLLQWHSRMQMCICYMHPDFVVALENWHCIVNFPFSTCITPEIRGV